MTRLWLWLLLLVGLPGVTQAQTDYIPGLIGISVNPDHSVTFMWETPPPSIDSLFIWRRDGSYNTNIANTDQPQTGTYILPASLSQCSQKPETFALASKNADNEGKLSRFITTAHLRAKIDSCTKRILLSWSPYIDPLYANAQQTIYYQSPSQAYTPLVTLSPTDREYLCPELQPGISYRFYVVTKTVNPGNFESSSNSVEIKAVEIPFIQFSPFWVNTHDNEISTSNTPGWAQDLFNIKMVKGVDCSSLTDTLPIHSRTMTTISFVDNTDVTKLWYYKLIALNPCNQVAFQTPCVSNLVLTADNETLSWTNLAHASHYQVIELKNKNRIPVSEILYDTTYTLPPITETRCVVIEAQLKDEQATIQSNTVCLYPALTVRMPEAFTPNGDGRNDVYKPISVDGNITSFEMLIFDSNGKLMFRSLDATVGWDGTSTFNKVRNGEVFVYIIKVKSATGATREYKGNFVAVIP